MGAYVLGAIQNDFTAKRIVDLTQKSNVVLGSLEVSHPEFADALLISPVVIVAEEADVAAWRHECFGPVIFIVRTSDSKSSLKLAANAANEIGAITCLLFTTDKTFETLVVETMNLAFTPVSVNFTGAAFVNQHAAFSDFHVSGGNPSGNAGFTNPEYVNKRWIWVGNRYA